MNTRQWTSSLLCLALLLGSGIARAEQPAAALPDALATPAWQERVQEQLQHRLDHRLAEDMEQHFAGGKRPGDSEHRLAKGGKLRNPAPPQPFLHDHGGRQRITLPAELPATLRSHGASLI